jgi:hypothetical protein
MFVLKKKQVAEDFSVTASVGKNYITKLLTAMNDLPINY